MAREHDYRFGPFRLDLASERLWRVAQELVLRRKSFAVLRYLLERAGRLVSRDEVLEAIWPGIVVNDAALTVCISELRQVLGDGAQTPEYIETVHGRGYRFIGTITAAPGLEGVSETDGPQQMTPRSFPLGTHSSVLSPVVLVGREGEIVQLEQYLEQARRGVRQVVFVTGEPGIGKTTLVDAFLAKVASAMPLRLARGQCIAHYGAGEAYLPVLDALGRLCREPGSEPLLAQLTKHAPTWLVQMPALLGAAELEALQRHILGASRERMVRELVEALEALTDVCPLILVLEDLHWSDYATLDLISWLAQRRDMARLLVLGTYRPVEVIVHGHPLQTVRQELLRHRQCVEVPLELLTAAEVAQYLEARFAVGVALRESFRALAQVIYRRTDGYPLFMVTLVDALAQQGSLIERDGQWEVQAAVDRIAMDVPESLQQLVEQQLSQLGTEGQRVLEAASVTGMQFSAAAVAAGLEETVDAVEEQCSTLARRGQFLRSSGIEEWPDGTVAGRYRFRHTLYHQVVYERMPVGQRIQLHARIGAREEVGHRERAGERAAELAMHFEQGREYGRAIRYRQQAAENALRRAAYRQAIDHLNRGLALLPRLPDARQRARQELDLQLALGQTLTVTQGPGAPTLQNVYARAEELCRNVGDLSQRVAVLRGLRRMHQGRGDPRAAHPLAEQFLGLAEQAQDLTLLMEAYMALGVASFYLGDVAAAHTHLERSTSLYASQPPRAHVFPSGQDLGVLGLTYDAMALWMLGYPGQALERSRLALNLAEEVAQPWSLAMAMGYSAFVHVLRGHRQAALAQAGATIQLATAQGLPSWVARAMMLQGWALAEQGQRANGLAQIQQGLAIWRADGQELAQPFWLALLAEQHGKAGQVEKGLHLLSEALELAHGREARLWEAELYRLQGEFLLRQAPGKGDKVIAQTEIDAQTCFRQALDIAHRQRAKSLELRAAMSLSRLWQRQGKKTVACQMLTAFYTWFSEGFDTVDLQEARALLEQLGG
ncbi:MAG TPA: AAA family ATPase [Candidatus Tectomicrobia bacterium]|nr:AAA family ATPase [Candidatus Tectomicrobia bacterium]